MEEILKLLWKVQYNANPELFAEIFGNLGFHLWDKYIYDERNLLNFAKGLDSENYKKLNDYLFKLQTL